MHYKYTHIYHGSAQKVALKHIQSQPQPAITPFMNNHTAASAAMVPSTNEKTNQPITSHNSGKHKADGKHLPAIPCKEQAATKPGASSKAQSKQFCISFQIMNKFFI